MYSPGQNRGIGGNPYGGIYSPGQNRGIGGDPYGGMYSPGQNRGIGQGEWWDYDRKGNYVEWYGCRCAYCRRYGLGWRRR